MSVTGWPKDHGLAFQAKRSSNVHMNPVPQASVQINRSMKENLEGRKDYVRSSLDDEDKRAKKSNDEEDTFDHK